MVTYKFTKKTAEPSQIIDKISDEDIENGCVIEWDDLLEDYNVPLEFIDKYYEKLEPEDIAQCVPIEWIKKHIDIFDAADLLAVDIKKMTKYIIEKLEKNPENYIDRDGNILRYLSLEEKIVQDFIEKYYNDDRYSIDLKSFGDKFKSLPLDFIAKFESHWDWTSIKIVKPEEFYFRFKHKLDKFTITKYVIENYGLNKIDTLEPLFDVFDWETIANHSQENRCFQLKYVQYIGWDNIWYKLLNEEDIEKYKDQLNWAKLCEQKNFDDDLIIKFRDYVDWNVICKEQVLSMQIIKKFKRFLNWDNVLKYQKNITEDFVENNINRIKVIYPGEIKYSFKFLDKYAEKLDWDHIFDYHTNDVYELFSKHGHLIKDWETFNKECRPYYLNRDFVIKYYKKLSSDIIEKYGTWNAETLDLNLIDIYFEKIDDVKFIRKLCDNPKLTEEIIEKHIDKIRFDSPNIYTKISMNFVKKYYDKLDLRYLCQYTKLPEEFIIEKDLIKEYEYRLLILEHQKISMDFIEKYCENSYEYRAISYNKEIVLPREFILKNSTYLKFSGIIQGKGKIPLGIIQSFLDNNDYIDAQDIIKETIETQKYPLHFVLKNIKYFDTKKILENYKLSEDQLYEYDLIKKYTTETILTYQKISEKFIEKNFTMNTKLFKIVLKNQKVTAKFENKYKFYASDIYITKYFHLSKQYILENIGTKLKIIHLRKNKNLKRSYDFCLGIPLQLKIKDSIISKYTRKLVDITIIFK